MSRRLRPVIFLVGFIVLFGLVKSGWKLTSLETTTTSTVPTAAMCQSSDLRVRWVDGSASAGTIHAWVRIHKASGPLCKLPAYFTVNLYDNAGGALPGTLSPMTESDSLTGWFGQPLAPRSTAIDLKTGDTVGVALSFGNDSSCPAVATMQFNYAGTSGANQQFTVAPTYMSAMCNGGEGIISPTFTN